MFTSNNKRIGLQGRAGFTLIELVIVLLVLGVITAILFPILTRGKQNALRSHCQSNLKQIGLGFMQYARDYDEKFPGRGGNRAPNYSWRQTLQPYIKSSVLFSCPSNPQSNIEVDAAGQYYPAINRSYGMSAWFNHLTMGGVDSPATKILAGELVNQNWTDYGSPDWRGANARNWGNGFAGHLDGTNYLFSDGHVKWMHPLRTASPLNMWGALRRAVPGCRNASVNCDTSEPDIVRGMKMLEDQHQ